MYFQSRMFIIALVLDLFIFCTLFAQTNNDLNGRWITVDSDIIKEYRLDNGNFEELTDDLLTFRGTYTINNGNINFNDNYIHGDFLYSLLNVFRSPSLNLDSRWYTLDEANIIFRSILMELGFSESEVNNEFHSMFIPNSSFQYSVDAYTLILTSTEGNKKETIIFNRE